MPLPAACSRRPLALPNAASLPEGCRTPGFFEGVASGDPLPDAVVLWTRFSPAGGENSTEAVPVAWRVAPDANLTQVAARCVSEHAQSPCLLAALQHSTAPRLPAKPRACSGNVTTDASRDFTVKVDVRGLQPDQRYW